MKEEIKNELLKRSLSYLDKAEAFANKEVPAFIKELMEFKFIEHLATGAVDSVMFTMFVGTFAILLAVVGLCCIQSDNRKEVTIVQNIFLSAGVIYPLVFLLGLAGNNADFIKAYKAKAAPRVYLMDYVRGK